MNNQSDMVEFISQFRLIDGFYVERQSLENAKLLEKAIELGFVEMPKPKTRCSYHPAAFCTIKGRLFLKRNLKAEL